MKQLRERLIQQTIAYFGRDCRRIHHFLKVYAFASIIASGESLDEDTTDTLLTAAVLHDIGIKVSEEKYKSSSGYYQEKEGPAVAEKMMRQLGFSPDKIERVCFLIAHHHHYDNIQDMDHQILVEADFLVNAYEDGLSESSVRAFLDKVFVTQTGRDLLTGMFLS